MVTLSFVREAMTTFTNQAIAGFQKKGIILGCFADWQFLVVRLAWVASPLVFDLFLLL